ncbi:CRISPR-associated helicase Cas3' [Tabrizicola oligotrophica]|uniref:CRISPR-associated helicase Cas3 n=1 Tax=Tabrizicola oligotrophica TaxID=2710650 RepID=A0A6M0QUX0_9RHOB|nr:CRISPR-associated helicase Cas3' [Tabrizicola oligotrophica]NEY91286.1 CRISPR-associated helicase Cas3' [Tabrizicola oligotrophica]
MQDYHEWPGKSAMAEGGPEHPAVYHMLDVAAVAERLIAPFGHPAPLRDALILLVALHDLGKISESFRDMILTGASQTFRHWELTEVLLLLNDTGLARRLAGSFEVRLALYAAVSGHHGRPSDRGVLWDTFLSPREPMERYKARLAIGCGNATAASVIEAFCDLWPDASLEGLSDQQATTLSWWLPGFCAAADWVGSNTAWFQPQSFGLSLPEYLAKARQTAAVAVAGAGLAGCRGKPGDLFNFALRPMQAACRDLPLPDGPALAVIEDETGAGKTEAALLLAHRMVLAGKGRGIFFALPTMATADAMFARAGDILGRMFDAPTLTLAHGRAGLSVTFRDLVEGGAAGEDAPSCTGWLAESRRRALLADVGVGTIDQALLSVLPVRHQCLRHFGLSSKILIVDEVHEMGEPYIATELERLLQMHRAAGGSAILLTATLPLALRERLLAVYGGAGPGAAYPALTVAGAAAVTEFARDGRTLKGPVAIQRIDCAEAAVDIIAASAAQGAACVWVRNAVDDAIAAVGTLRARGIKASLLHARYTLHDRKRIESEVLARVGKDGAGRTGYVLVGTQVLEASLDLDFDVMLSDIAPVAALIQRAGRLWRHMDRRPADARPVAAPVLQVLSPDPEAVPDARWLHGTLGGGAFVYSVADVWRSARVLFAAGRIDAPAGLRALIEAVHGEDAEAVPDALIPAETETQGKDAAARTHAIQNLVRLEDGFRRAGRGADDATYPTRLGEETRTLVLARRESGALRPWAPGCGVEAWALSEVSASRRRLDRLALPEQSAPEIAAITRDWPEWRAGQVQVCPVAEDGTICEGLRYDEALGLVIGEKG